LHRKCLSRTGQIVVSELQSSQLRRHFPHSDTQNPSQFIGASRFSAAAQRQLHVLFPDAIVVGSADAYVLGLNVVSDGLHVVLPAAATGFAKQLGDVGFEPVGVDLSELLKGGGSVKCCTLEVFA
jgi:hypothetical protein